MHRAYFRNFALQYDIYTCIWKIITNAGEYETPEIKSMDTSISM